MTDEKEILKKILKNWSAREEIIECIDGCYFPQNIKSPHQQFSIPSDALAIYMKSLLETLRVFHEYAETNNIIYSLHAGTLIGYYWNGGIIPWDDDMDIIVGESSFLKIKDNLWKLGQRQKTKCRIAHSPWRQRQSRIVELGGNKYELLDSGLRKFTLTPLGDFNKTEPGGIDIGVCKALPNGKLNECWMEGRVCFGPTDDSLLEDYPVVTFGGVETRAASRELGEPYLDQVYGSRWRIPCHPEMKKENPDIEFKKLK